MALLFAAQFPASAGVAIGSEPIGNFDSVFGLGTYYTTNCSTLPIGDGLCTPGTYTGTNGDAIFKFGSDEIQFNLGWNTAGLVASDADGAKLVICLSITIDTGFNFDGTDRSSSLKLVDFEPITTGQRFIIKLQSRRGAYSGDPTYPEPVLEGNTDVATNNFSETYFGIAAGTFDSDTYSSITLTREDSSIDYSPPFYLSENTRHELQFVITDGSASNGHIQAYHNNDVQETPGSAVETDLNKYSECINRTLNLPINAYAHVGAYLASWITRELVGLTIHRCEIHDSFVSNWYATGAGASSGNARFALMANLISQME